MSYHQNLEWTPGRVVTLSTHLEKPSPFYFGYDINQKLTSVLNQYTFDKIFFFTEENLFELYGKELYNQLKSKFDCRLEFVPAGEKCKYFPVLEEVCESLIAKGVSKKSILIAFGN